MAASGNQQQARTRDASKGARPAVGKKKPYALCCGYVGTGYQGMQYNEGCHTIEGELLKAVHAAGGISDENMSNSGQSGLGPLQKTGWMRASRTDKGVHAVMNLLSMKMVEPADGDIKKYVETINSNLPKQIRLYAVERVVGSFHAKFGVSHRYYNYVLPTFAFVEQFSDFFDKNNASLDLEVINNDGKDDDEMNGGDDDVDHKVKRRKGDNKKVITDEVPAVGKYDEIPDDLFNKLCNYRMSDATREGVDQVLSQFVGTNWFQNYTKGKQLGDPSCQRYITEFKIMRVDIVDGIEVATISVKGAAFLLHQIRRMVAMGIIAWNAKLGPSFIQKSVQKDSRIPIPTAPPTGLLLERLLFDHYHSKLDALKSSKQAGTESLRHLTFPECADQMEGMHAAIRTEIMSQERSGRVMACWIRSLPHISKCYLDINMHEECLKKREEAVQAAEQPDSK
eukprot:TRINITY_DN1058_c1_g1_i1.p1 TRINITY_DN1058_c1_g1~~TRINITY_DN1058_c1_g1_i1.p1  ORF type:complete len:465 (+),score=94.70 TRINITY_DN1058_c1_g1_i1:39-1397(+)